MSCWCKTENMCVLSNWPFSLTWKLTFVGAVRDALDQEEPFSFWGEATQLILRAALSWARPGFRCELGNPWQEKLRAPSSGTNECAAERWRHQSFTLWGKKAKHFSRLKWGAFSCIFHWPVLLSGQELLEWTAPCVEGIVSHAGFTNVHKWCESMLMAYNIKIKALIVKAEETSKNGPNLSFCYSSSAADTSSCALFCSTGWFSCCSELLKAADMSHSTGSTCDCCRSLKTDASFWVIASLTSGGLH